MDFVNISAPLLLSALFQPGHSKCLAFRQPCHFPWTAMNETEMHLFSQLEEFANMRTRVNSLANLRQAGPSLSCQLRPFLSLLQCPALSFSLFYTVLFHSIQFFHIVFFVVCYSQCCYSLVYPVLLSSHYISHHSSLTELLFSCMLSNNVLSIYSLHSFP